MILPEHRHADHWCSLIRLIRSLWFRELLGHVPRFCELPFALVVGYCILLLHTILRSLRIHRWLHWLLCHASVVQVECHLLLRLNFDLLSFGHVLLPSLLGGLALAILQLLVVECGINPFGGCDPCGIRTIFWYLMHLMLIAFFAATSLFPPYLLGLPQVRSAQCLSCIQVA